MISAGAEVTAYIHKR
ncbi:MAG: hypothetical protein IT342_05405 [Candidatus Melainabacteria bacterium]|nr:hypothetical protein [Candidatus Melainabacteria bacterium]